MSAVLSPEAAVAVPTSPFKGLEPYDEEDAAFFFGREEWREIIIDNLRAYRLTLLYGGSGVGKSSVLRAGVVHELHTRAQRNLERSRMPGNAVALVRNWRVDQDVLAELVRAIHDAVADYPEAAADAEEADDAEPAPNVDAEPAVGTKGENAAPERSLNGAPGEGRSNPVPDPEHDLQGALRAAARRAGGKVFVILDQFEEYFLYHPAPEAKPGFEAALADAVKQLDLRASFLISIREDQLAALDRFRAKLPGLFDNYLRIGPLDEDEAEDAIRKPLAEYNRVAGTDYTISDDLVAQVVAGVQSGKVVLSRGGAGVVAAAADAVRGTIQAPYLQLVLKRLWDTEVSAKSHELRAETFEQLGGAPGIVRTHLDTTMAGLKVAERDTAAKLLNYLVTPSGTKIAQTPADLARYTEVPERQVRRTLEDLSSGSRRIIRPAGEDRFEIYHDALATPILTWRARWQEEQQHRRARRQLRIYAGVALLCIGIAAVVVVLAIRAKIASDNAKRATAAATELSLASTAQTLLVSRPDVSLIMALASYARNPKLKEARASMTAALEAADLSGASRILHGSENTVTSVAFDPSGSRLASASADGTVRLWNAATGRQDGAVLAAGAPMFSVAFSPNGRLVAGGDQTGTVHIWSTATRRPITAPIRVRPGLVISLGFSRDGNELAAASLVGGVRIIKLTAGRPGGQIDVPLPPGHVVRAVAFSSDSRWLAAASTDTLANGVDHGTVQLVDPVTGAPSGPSVVIHSQLYAVSFVGPDQIVTGGNAGGIWLWRVGAPAASKLGNAQPDVAVNGLAQTPDGHLFAAALSDGSVQLWTLFGGAASLTLTGSAGLVTSVAFSPHDDAVAAGSTDRTIRLWPIPVTGAIGNPLATDSRVRYVAAMAFDSAARTRRFAAGGPFGLWTWSDPNGTTFGRRISTVNVRSLALVGETLAAGNVFGVLRTWNLSTGRSQRLFHDPSNPIESVAISPDGHTLAYAGDRGTIGLWDLVHARPLRTFTPNAGRIFTLAFSPTEKMLASAGDDRTIRLWSLTSGKQIRQLTGDSDAIFSVAFSRNGSTLASGSADDTVRLWDVASGRQIGQPLTGHHGYVYTVAFSPDGRTLASGSRDGTLRLWDVASRTQLGQAVTASTGRVTSVAFYPDGRSLLTGGSEGAVRSWPVVVLPSKLSVLKARVCGIVGTGLTHSEWNDYAAAPEYTNPCG